MNIKHANWLTEWLIDLGLWEMAAIYIKLAILLLILFILCYIGNLITKRILLRAIRAYISKTKTTWDDIFVENKVFITLSHIVPAIIIYLTATFVFSDFAGAIPYVIRLVNIYITAILIMVIINFLNALKHIVETSRFFKGKPVNSIFQLAKIIIYLVGGIIVLSFNFVISI